jgi:hypothetical protein
VANVPQKPCISFNAPPFSLPAIFSTTSNLITVPIPNLPTGEIPCCQFQIPAFNPPLPLPPLPGLGVLVTALNLIIQEGLASLNTLQIPSCPL